MKIKVCGLGAHENAQEISELPGIDFLGFIFHPGSKRYTEQTLSTSKKKIGVFVNASTETILSQVISNQLYGVQLHGNELPEEIRTLPKDLFKIKAFGIENENDFKQCAAFDGFVNLFLFDTKTPEHGGSGRKFPWEILTHYKGETPFLLSGGIGPDDVDALLGISHPLFYGIDINSKFETEPRLKNPELVNTFIQHLNK